MTQNARTFAMIACIVSAACAANAQQSRGTITGVYNADDAIWTIGSPETDSLPASGFRDTDDGLEVTLVGLPGQAAEADHMEGPFDRALVVSFTLEGSPQELAATEPQVWMPDDARDERMMADPMNIDLSITVAQMAGDELVLAGDLVAILTPGGRGGLITEAEELGTEDAFVFDGNFQGTLQRIGGEEGEG